MYNVQYAICNMQGIQLAVESQMGDKLKLSYLLELIDIYIKLAS